MSDDSVQNYGNHVRWLPPYHFIIFPILAANAVWTLVQFFRAPGIASGWAVLVAFAVTGGIFYARYMALRVQDRVIRMEETLRLERLMPGRYADYERLDRRQLIALRFASDAELPHLVERVLAGELSGPDDIKRAVQHWRPDHLRA